MDKSEVESYMALNSEKLNEQVYDIVQQCMNKNNEERVSFLDLDNHCYTFIQENSLSTQSTSMF